MCRVCPGLRPCACACAHACACACARACARAFACASSHPCVALDAVRSTQADPLAKAAHQAANDEASAAAAAAGGAGGTRGAGKAAAAKESDALSKEALVAKRKQRLEELYREQLVEYDEVLARAGRGGGGAAV